MRNKIKYRKKEINHQKLYSIIQFENLPKYLAKDKPILFPHELLIDNNILENEFSYINSQKQRNQTIKKYIIKNYLPILVEEKEFTTDNIFLFVSRIKNKQISRNSFSIKNRNNHRYTIDNELIKQLDKTNAKDIWAEKIWRQKGKPNFNKRIISGVKYGKGFVITNNKKGFDRIIIRRYIGVEIINNKITINCPD